MDAGETPGEGAVRRRVVFYLPGFDPSPARRYRELYRREGAAQAAISGHELAVGPGPAGGPYGWRVTARIGGARVETRFEVLHWGDLVRDGMAHGIAATYLRLWRTARVYLASGALGRLLRLRKGPVLAALYPVAMLLGQLAVAAGIGVLGGLVVAAWLPPVVAALAAIGAVWLTLRAFRRLDHRLYAHYLMLDYAYCASARGAYPAALGDRLGAFADRVAAALAQPVDEVLVVGHSSGAHLAVSVLAEVLRRAPGPRAGPALSLLTLGHAVPMVSFLPAATRLRGDLRALSMSRDIAWVDVTAPADGACFALCDPVAVSGVAGAGRGWPLVLSAAFSRTLSPGRRAALRWRFFRTHFQYLHAFDRPGIYDYFAVTAGPLTLARRYAGRASSPGRVAAALSPHTAAHSAAHSAARTASP